MKCVNCGKEIKNKTESVENKYCNYLCKKARDIAESLKEIPEDPVKEELSTTIEWEKRKLFGKRYENCTFDNYVCKEEKQRKIIVDIKNISDKIKSGEGRILAFVGNPGTGKDHIAAAMVEYIKPNRVKMTTVLKISRELRESGKDKSTIRQQSIIDELTSQNMLIINEIGLQSVSQFEHSFLHEIIDSYYRNMQTCLLISNEGEEKFKACIDDPLNLRVWDRISDIIVFDWLSYRPEQRKG